MAFIEDSRDGDLRVAQQAAVDVLAGSQGCWSAPGFQGLRDAAALREAGGGVPAPGVRSYPGVSRVAAPPAHSREAPQDPGPGPQIGGGGAEQQQPLVPNFR